MITISIGARSLEIRLPQQSVTIFLKRRKYDVGKGDAAPPLTELTVRVNSTQTNQYLRTIGQNLGHVRTQDCLSMNNMATKRGQRKHKVDHNDDDVDDSGPDALYAIVNEEGVKAYDPA